MTQVDINGSDRTKLHVLHLDLPREAVERFTRQAGTGEWPLKYALGATELRENFVDVVDLRDLEGMTLTDYMAQAYTIPKSALKPDQARLNALTGHVLLLPYQVFSATTQTLTISPPLTHLGTYGEPTATARGAAVKTPSAQGRAETGRAAGLGPANSSALKFVLLGVGVLLLLILALILR